MKRALFLGLSLLAFQFVFSQKKTRISELGLFLGCSYYLGDLNPTRHFHMAKPAGGLMYRYNFNPRFAARGNLFLGGIQGDDSQTYSEPQQQRNLHFKSRIFELSGQIEFNFLEYHIGNLKKHYFTPYVFVGAGVFNFQPKAKLDNNWYNLQPLTTERQRKYSLYQFSIPFGTGIKVNLASNVSAALEWGMRKTFTDYLDDVSTVYADPYVLASEKGSIAATLSDRSVTFGNNTGRQRGNSKNKDWYNYTGLIISFKLKERMDSCPTY